MSALSPPPRIAVVVAHPDDETTMGGTLAHYAALGSQILVICATNGAGGASTDTDATASLGLVRRGEMSRACQALGVSLVVFLEDAGAPHLGQHNYSAALASQAQQTSQLLADFRPDVLLTFGRDGVTGHPTHIMVGAMARTACGLAQLRPVIHEVAYRQSEVSAVLAWLEEHPVALDAYRQEVTKAPNIGAPTPEFFPIPPFLAYVVVDVAAQRGVRLTAARQHRSQGGLSYLAAYVATDVECFVVLDVTGEPVLGRAVQVLVTNPASG